jgi:hypothetical protein
MLEAFAKAHRFRVRPEYEKEFQKTLDSSFSLNEDGLVRSFGQLSSLVHDGHIWIFRAVELLDLNPHAQSYSTHFSRIVALFDAPPGLDDFFMLNKSMQAIQRLPRSKPPNPEVTDATKRVAVSCKARHPLSVTVTHGQGLIYFEPLVTGGETIDDVDCLYCIAKGMHEKPPDDLHRHRT